MRDPSSAMPPRPPDGAADANERRYRAILARAPDDRAARQGLARLLGRTGRTDAALALVAEAGDDPDALALTAELLVAARRPPEADAVFAALRARDPDTWTHAINHGRVLNALGRTDEAAAAYRAALARAPGSGAAWWALADLRAAPLDAGDVAAIRAALDGACDPAARIALHFALGHALDRIGEHAGAWAAFVDGNALRRARAPYDAAATSAALRAHAAAIPAGDSGGDLSPDPIFVVGLPRSGTTLVEQILASHPLIEGVGELHALNAVARAGAGRPAAAMGADYLAAARRHRRTDRRHFVDKMPSNWVHAALIGAILPNARIVDVRRHPVACGLANFTQLYAHGNDWSYDLAAIGQFQRDHAWAMARVAGGRVHRLHYEALVADPAGEVRRLLAFLALPLDPACLTFYETSRAVHTPSAAQVRRPIDRAGVTRWTAYADRLGPLATALGPLARDYPAF